MVWTGYGVKCFQKYQRFTALKPRGAHKYFHLSFYGTQRGRWWYLFLQCLEDIIFTYCRMGLRENTCLEIPGFWFSWQIGKGERGGGMALCEGRSSLHLARFSCWEVTSRSPCRTHPPHKTACFPVHILPHLYLHCDTVSSLFPSRPSGCRLYLFPLLLHWRYLVRVLQAGCSVTA